VPLGPAQAAGEGRLGDVADQELQERLGLGRRQALDAGRVGLVAVERLLAGDRMGAHQRCIEPATLRAISADLRQVAGAATRPDRVSSGCW
jgi:hypothetical protein